MRLVFSAALIAVLAFVATASISRPAQAVRLTPGQTYVYEYTSRLLSGVPELGDQFAGFEITGDLILQALGDSVVAMKLSQIKVGKHNGPVGNDFPQGEVVMDHQMNAQYQKELTKPIRFVYQDGKVKAFEADQSEPEWSLNMKKAILSLLNVNLQPKKIIKSSNSNQIQRPDSDLTVYPIYEEGIGGICETVYEINNVVDPKYPEQDEAFVLNVTKTRNYDNCLTEPVIVNDNYDVRGCPWVCRKEKSFPAVAGYYPTPDAVTDPYMVGCPCGKEPHDSPVESYSYAKYNISLQQSIPIIEGIYAEGKTVYKTNGDELLIITQQNLTLNAQGNARVSIPAIPRPQRHNELSFRIPKPVLPQGQKLPLDIPYYHLFGQPNIAELQNLIPELLDSLASDLVSGELSGNKDSMQKTVQMVNAMAVLPQEALLSIFEEVAQSGHSNRATQKEQVVRKLYLDALPLAGSNPSALFIAYLIQQNKVTTFEAKELVEAVPQNLFLIDTQTLDAYLELFQSPKVQARRHLAASAGIAFGKMVKEACVKRQSTPGDTPDDNVVPHPKRNLPASLVVQSATPQSRVTVNQKTSFSNRMKRSISWEESFQQDVCSPADIEKYVQIIGRLLSQAKSFHKKVTLIETIAHMGVPQALPVLAPYISGNIPESQCPGYVTENKEQTAEECDFVRRVAIYALKHVTEHYPKQVQPLVYPVYFDRSESYELRIAAFTTLVFTDPEKQVLERIGSELHSEPNRQIRSYVVSSLETIGNITIPCFQKMADKASQAYDHSPEAEYGYQFSKMMGYDFYAQEKDFGLYSFANWVANNNSQVPRAAYFALGQSNGPFQDELVQIGFQAKGMEALIERALGSDGIIADMFNALSKGKDRRVTKRSADNAQQALEALKSQLSQAVRSDDEPKATIFFKLFDRTSYYALDKHYVHALIDEAEDWLKDLANILLSGQTYHYVKLVMPSQLYKVVPSELGLPLVITHRHPTILSLKVDSAKLQIAGEPKTVFPTGANITAQVQPSIFYSSYAFAFAVNTADKQAYGTHVQKTSHATFPVELSVGFSRPKNQITWSVVPKETEVIYHKTQTQTFIAKANIAGSPDRDWLQEAQEVTGMAVPFKHEYQLGQELLGIGVRAQFNTENPWEPYQSVFSSDTNEKYGIVAAVVESWRNPGLYPRELHVQIESDREEPIQGYDFAIRYKWISDDEETEDDDDSDESSASDESDSDQSDESSESKSSESNSSESNSDEKNDKKSKSSQSSEESNESNISIKKRIRNRMAKVIAKVNDRRRRSVDRDDDNNKDKDNDKESNESSDESSNESGSKSFSKSGSKESSQSSSSESNSSEQKHKHIGKYSKNNSKNKSKYNSHSAQSSESSSSSSESDESQSFEDYITFDYEDVMKLILAQDFKKHSIKRIANQLIRKTQKVWEINWDEDYDQSSEDESDQDESTEVPQTIAHDIVFTAVARGPRPSYYAANILYVHTFDHRINWLKTDGHIKTPKGVYMTVPTLFCADAIIAYPTIPNEFYYEVMEGQKARIQAQVGWGEQCQSDGGLLITGVMEQTEDHVITPEQLATQEGSSPAHVQNWFYKQCAIDRSEGQSQSYACERAIIEESYFNQLILDIKYKNVPKEVQNITQKAALGLKVALYNHLEINGLDVDNPDEQIRIVAQYSQRIPNIPLANLLIKTPEENVQYSHIHIPQIRPPSSLLPVAEVYANLWTGYNYEDSCSLMEDYVRTFDNVTFKTEETPCQYLVAKDCSSHEKFAVFAQNIDIEAKTKTVTVMTSGSEIKLVPPQQQNIAQVVVDGKAHEIAYKKPVTIGAKNKNAVRIYLRATPSDSKNPIIVVESDINNLVVKYDGKNVKVTVGGEYSGKTCGLCGDNNDETEEEFAGPDMCIYDEAQDFFNSYALSGAHCAKAPHPIGQKRCPQYDSADNEDYEQSGVVRRKEVKTVIHPNGETTIVRQQVENQPSQAIRSQIVENQANVEEIQRQQQKQVENQMARQEGEPLGEEQENKLFGATPEQQKLLTRLRTQYIQRDDMTCFTIKPVLSCINNGQPSSLKQVKADFHCLPKTSPFTQQLIVESEKQIIRQLVNKRVDLRQQIEVPVSCV